MDKSIIGSEKVTKKSTYKNKFQQFQEQQQKNLLFGTISSPPPVPYTGKQLLVAKKGIMDPPAGYGSMNDSIEGSFEGVSKDQSMSGFGQNQNAYAINLGKKPVNKKVKNLNEQVRGIKNFKEDLVLFQQNTQLQKNLLKNSSTEFANTSIEKSSKPSGIQMFRTKQQTPGGVKRIPVKSKADISRDTLGFISTGQTPDITPGISHKKTSFKTPGKKMTSIFDTTTEIPSTKNRGISKTVDKKDNISMKNEKIGYVNYINGVPVSIQFNLSEKPQQMQTLQPSSWKQNMVKRNDLLNNNDVTKMQQRNEVEINQFLPNIEKKKVVKPNYYKNKRKMNYSNLYEDDVGYIQTSVQNDSINRSQVFAKEPLKNANSKQTLKGEISNLERRAESMYQPKREKRFRKQSPSKQSRSSSRKKVQKKSPSKKRIIGTAQNDRSKSPLESPNLPYGDGPINLEIGTSPSMRSRSKPVSNIKSIREKVIGVNTKRTFHKIEMDPSLFKIQVQKRHLEHLNKDDLDEISKYEVIYKILKDQLRIHQAKLIEMKQDDMKRKASGKISPLKKKVDMKEFARHVKPFDWYGPQRDLSPEIKRIVKNLVCQEHQYVYCPCCKQYDEMEYDPLETINKFMQFIRGEQNKLNPPPKPEPKKKKRPPEMPDDSLSEITDIEYEEVMHKYYTTKLDKINTKKEERARTRKRLQGANVDMKHSCKPSHIRMAKRGINNEERVELLLRQPEEGKSMHDDEISAHQFSERNVSIQADSEERMEAELLSQKDSSPTRPIGSRGTTTRVLSVKSGGMSRNQSTTSVGRVTQKLRDKDSLFNLTKTKTEMGIQTDGESDNNRSPLKSRAANKTVKIEQSENGSVEKIVDPDKYKEDWVNALCYKKAMKAEAIKRGVRVDSEYEVDEDDERVAMTCTNFDASTTMGLERDPNADLELEFGNQFQNTQDPDADNAIGFMKKYTTKGNIKMLTENEIQYIRHLLKQDTENWEHKSTLEDLYRHCKFTIRKLTRQMANIDNQQIFKKNRIPNRENTLFMVYRAERLYSALGDGNKICKHLAQHLFDTKQFEQIASKSQDLNKEDEKFIKKRENFIKRLQTQINGFLSQYSIFGDKFQFKEQHMRDFLQSELDKCRELKTLIDQMKQLGSNEISALSSRVDHDNNKRDIVTLPKVPGIVSPYLSKVSVPSEAQKSSRKSKMRSSNDQVTIESKRKNSSVVDQATLPNGSHNIIELRRSQNAKSKYEQLQSTHNALNNPKLADTEKSFDHTVKTKKVERDVDQQNPLADDSELNYVDNLPAKTIAGGYPATDESHYTLQTANPVGPQNITEQKQRVLLKSKETVETPRVKNKEQL